MYGSMPIGFAGYARGLGRAMNPPTMDQFPDAVLLDRFLKDRDEAAFETFVRRHGPKVLGVCRRKLGDSQEADDAFQATFLVLVNRADQIRHVGDVGGWLCGVARRVAARARVRADRRRNREGTPIDVSAIAGRDEPDLDDLGPILKAEVDRLPEKYRKPVELCYWEGMSSQEAAERLSCPTGTIKWRLSRAREILRGRLARFGIALTALLMGRWRETEAASLGAGCGGPGSPIPVGPSGGEIALPARLVRETVALAVLSLDSPLLLKMPREQAPVRKPAGWMGMFGNFTWMLILAAILLAIPAISLAMPTVFGIQPTPHEVIIESTPHAGCH